MQRALPERNHLVKFVAVYDDGANSHFFRQQGNDSLFDNAGIIPWETGTSHASRVARKNLGMNSRRPRFRLYTARADHRVRDRE
jgi:hypothetical protein